MLILSTWLLLIIPLVHQSLAVIKEMVALCCFITCLNILGSFSMECSKIPPQTPFTATVAYLDFNSTACDGVPSQGSYFPANSCFYYFPTQNYFLIDCSTNSLAVYVCADAQCGGNSERFSSTLIFICRLHSQSKRCSKRMWRGNDCSMSLLKYIPLLLFLFFFDNKKQKIFFEPFFISIPFSFFFFWLNHLSKIYFWSHWYEFQSFLLHKVSIYPQIARQRLAVS